MLLRGKLHLINPALASVKNPGQCFTMGKHIITNKLEINPDYNFHHAPQQHTGFQNPDAPQDWILMVTGPFDPGCQGAEAAASWPHP